MKDKNHYQVDGFKVFLAVLALILLATNGMTFYFLYEKMQEKNVLPQNQTSNTNIQNNRNSNENNNVAPVEEKDDNQALTNNQIKIAWYDSPKAADLNNSFNREDMETRADSTALDSPPADAIYPAFAVDRFFDEGQLYEVGKISEISPENPRYSLYDNAPVYLAVFPRYEPSSGSPMIRFVKNGSQLFLLNEYSYNIGQFYLSYFTLDTTTQIANITTPETIQMPHSDHILIRSEDKPWSVLSDYGEVDPLFKYTDNKYIYRSGQNCLLAQAPDSSVFIYKFKLGFLGQNTTVNNIGFSREANILDITWNDGSKNTQEYMIDMPYNLTNCAYLTADYISDPDSQLKIIGYTSDQEPIYELADINTKYSPEGEESVLETMYDNYYVPEGEEKISFEEFLAEKPLLFWEDPFGKFMIIKSAKYAPMAEMAKPVIYLYPEKTTDVLVKVSPNYGLTLTEPAYDNGWLVRAQPDGSLYNYSDKKIYPYLFWEGLGINYQTPREGFVVKREDIKDFLEKTLKEQGLIAKEYNEFIDFWAPFMQADPYYFITFVPQSEFDRLAPLDISPQPDTVIRVFMDYQGLDKPFDIQEPKLTTAKRQGFTVVEWGGARH